ncbi:zinc peptidase [Erythrobacter sp. KY5]|uniref:ImmA/IrrE family metallo-endopeptidase n=1 Tax=Erythrobacter sp. KY5 TaxID=2011159 RepID=UPI000DBF2AB4|nr:ImmA/IrrE family metallo-endopeptidase [Erythrobacter sp. KY5]AWW73124.1 zinc peptidase [Erythrobacter sp. KY5]
MAKTALRWGFKTEANAWARDLRLEMGLNPAAPLCPWKLAKYLEVPVYLAKDLLSGEQLAPLEPNDSGIPFSAVTFFEGPTAFVVQSTFVSKKRQAADLAHELAHVLLRHDPSAFAWIDGQRHYDDLAEAEAKWLGPALLISEEAALRIVTNGLSIADASDEYAASKDVVRMRLNVTGAQRRRGARAA